MSRIVLTFGRFNPPTIGHEKLINAVKKEAGSDDYHIYTSHSQDKKKNPLSSEVKVEYMKKMFPSHKDHIMYDPSLKTIINVLQKLQGTYTDVTLVVGSDRVPEMEKLITRYNGVEYTFRNIDVKSAGERDPDAEGATGMSASKMRAAAVEGDTGTFRKGIPSTLDNSYVIQLMRQVREGLGIK
jgi:nicotinic acid mononucleotide adenylyltransferase